MDNDDRNNSKTSVDELGCETRLPDSTVMDSETYKNDFKISVDELAIEILPPDSNNAIEEFNITSFYYKRDRSSCEIKITRRTNKRAWGALGVILGALLVITSLIVYIAKPALIRLF